MAIVSGEPLGQGTDSIEVLERDPFDRKIEAISRFAGLFLMFLSTLIVIFFVIF